MKIIIKTCFSKSKELSVANNSSCFFDMGINIQDVFNQYCRMKISHFVLHIKMRVKKELTGSTDSYLRNILNTSYLPQNMLNYIFDLNLKLHLR